MKNNEIELRRLVCTCCGEETNEDNSYAFGEELLCDTCYFEETVECEHCALLVSYNDDYAALMTYLPERRIYSVGQEQFYSFSSHKKLAEEPDKAAFMKVAEGYDEVWLVSYTDVNAPDMIFSDKNSVYFYLAGLDIAIFRIPVDRFAETAFS